MNNKKAKSEQERPFLSLKLGKKCHTGRFGSLPSLSKTGLEMSFSWLFSIIVGAAILGLAIYGTTSIIGTQRNVQDSELGKQIGVILTPLESGVADLKADVIKMPVLSRIYNRCREEGTFGSQELSVASSSGVGERQWQNPGAPSQFNNKYVFSSSTIEGERFNVLSKGIDFPFSIGEMTVVWPEEEAYCFVQPSQEIEREIGNLGLKNINVTERENECPKNSTRVCFTSSGCDIDVSVLAKSVSKKEGVVYYDESLIYGAIFADKGIYECQVRRLMKRAAELSSLYAAKSEFVSAKGCPTTLSSSLASYSKSAMALNSSIELRALSQLSSEIGRQNGLLNCKLF